MSKATMIFAKVDVKAPNHPRFHQAGPAAIGMWMAATCYAREYETDGRVPRSAFFGFYGVGKDAGEPLIAALVAAGLVADHGDELEVLKYADRNETKAEIAERRAGATKRQHDRREKLRTALLSAKTAHVTRDRAVTSHVTHGVGHGPVTDSDSDSVLKISEGVQGEATPLEEQLDASLKLPASQQAYWRAFVEGVRESGFATSYEWNQWNQAAVNRVVEAHGKGRRGEALLEFVRLAAKTYRKAANDKPDHAKYAYSPKSFEQWMAVSQWQPPRPRPAAVPAQGGPLRTETPLASPEESGAILGAFLKEFGKVAS